LFQEVDRFEVTTEIWQLHGHPPGTVHFLSGGLHRADRAKKAV